MIALLFLLTKFQWVLLKKLKDSETKLTDNFVENLKEDINGGIIAEIKERVST